jgi:phospho-N-acetylmuramoyl-pentapeptide-transferase
MLQILFSAAIALTVSITVTPVLIALFATYGPGQQLRIEGPAGQPAERVTPSMGGIAILAGVWAGYLGAHLIPCYGSRSGPTASGLLVLGLATGLGGVGLLDDLIRISQRRNRGLTATGKYLGQISAAIAFGALALRFPNTHQQTPASPRLSYVRDIVTVSFGTVVFIGFVCLIVLAWSNAVKVTDGLDGLAAGSMSQALGVYVVIIFCQYANSCAIAPGKGCYNVRDPLDLGLVCAATGASCLGFLWWNAAPAKISMGDSGALALGGVLAGLSITTRTELLTIVVGAVFFAEYLSVLLQVVVYRTTHHRLFQMAPFHHHFEVREWAETTVVIRFWLLAGIAGVTGLLLFGTEYLGTHG